MSEPIVALTTTSSLDEARRIAHALVEGRLAACVNIIPGVTSIYVWNAAVQEDAEFLLVMKSDATRVDALREKLLSIHSYEVAEFVVLPVRDISEPYARWISESVTP